MSAYHSFCKPLYSSARLGLGLGGDCTVPRPAGRFCLATPLPIFAISEGTVPNARGSLSVHTIPDSGSASPSHASLNKVDVGRVWRGLQIGPSVWETYAVAADARGVEVLASGQSFAQLGKYPFFSSIVTSTR